MKQSDQSLGLVDANELNQSQLFRVTNIDDSILRLNYQHQATDHSNQLLHRLPLQNSRQRLNLEEHLRFCQDIERKNYSDDPVPEPSKRKLKKIIQIDQKSESQKDDQNQNNSSHKIGQFLDSDSKNIPELDANSQYPQSIKNSINLQQVQIQKLSIEYQDNNNGKKNIALTINPRPNRIRYSSQLKNEQALRQFGGQQLPFSNVKNAQEGLVPNNQQTNSKPGWLSVTAKVQRFRANILENCRLLSYLRPEIVHLIDDKGFSSIHNTSNKEKGLVQAWWLFVYLILDVLLAIKKQLDRIPIFIPFNRWKIAYDIILKMYEIREEIRYDLKNYMLFILYLEAIVKLNTSFWAQGQLMKDRKIIFQNYLLSNFLFDLICLISLQASEGFTPQNGWLVLQFLKVIDLAQTNQRIADFFNFQGTMRSIYELLSLLTTLIEFTHFFAVLWHGLALLEIQSLGMEQTWLRELDLIDETNVIKRYINSFYFALVTTTTVGYGDITAQNYVERVFVIVMLFGSGIFYAYTINNIGQIMEDIKMQKKRMNQERDLIEEYMRENSVSADLRTRIQNYVIFMHKQDNPLTRQQQKDIISKLSGQLQDELRREILGKHLNHKNNVLNRFVGATTKNNLMKLMHEQVFSAGEVIFQEGQTDSGALYFIHQGAVSVSVKDKEVALLKHDNVSTFGEYSFITGMARTESAVAAEYCKLYSIERAIFIQEIEKNKNEWELFHFLRENVILNLSKRSQKLGVVELIKGVKSLLQTIFKTIKTAPNLEKNSLDSNALQCHCCAQAGHTSDSCPKTHLKLNKTTIIERYRHKERQEYEMVQAERQKRQQLLSKRKKVRSRDGNTLYNVQEAVFDFLNNIENFQIIEQFSLLAKLPTQDEAEKQLYIQQMEEEEEFIKESRLRDSIADENLLLDEDQHSKTGTLSQISHSHKGSIIERRKQQALSPKRDMEIPSRQSFANIEQQQTVSDRQDSPVHQAKLSISQLPQINERYSKEIIQQLSPEMQAGLNQLQNFGKLNYQSQQKPQNVIDVNGLAKTTNQGIFSKGRRTSTILAPQFIKRQIAETTALVASANSQLKFSLRESQQTLQHNSNDQLNMNLLRKSSRQNSYENQTLLNASSSSLQSLKALALVGNHQNQNFHLRQGQQPMLHNSIYSQVEPALHSSQQDSQISLMKRNLNAQTAQFNQPQAEAAMIPGAQLTSQYSDNLFIIPLDCLQNFKFFRPEGNCEKVLFNIQIYQQILRRQLITQKPSVQQLDDIYQHNAMNTSKGLRKNIYGSSGVASIPPRRKESSKRIHGSSKCIHIDIAPLSSNGNQEKKEIAVPKYSQFKSASQKTPNIQ